MLDTPEVVALRKKLIDALKKSPPRTGVLANLAFHAWLEKNLTPEEFLLTAKMEATVGEEACNQWMVDLMVETGLYKSDEPGYVEGV